MLKGTNIEGSFGTKRWSSGVCVFTENEVEISLAIRPGGNVVQVYGFCFDAPDGKPRIVLELCAHGSLRDHLRALPRDKVLPCQQHSFREWSACVLL